MVQQRVVIVGGGFVGLNAARGLAGANCDVTLVDRRNHHLFQPLLYQVATGGLSPADIAAPLRGVLSRAANVRVVQALVRDVDVTARQVVLDDGRLDYDTLIVATGAHHDYFGNDGWSAYAPGLKTVDDATAIRNRLLGAFECAERAVGDDERRALLSFVIVGGGATGVELAGAVAELARHTLRRDFRSFDPSRARVLLVEAGERLLPGYPERLSERAAAALRRLGVEVTLDTKVTGVDADGATLNAAGGDRRVEAATVLWAAGVRADALGRALARATGLSTDRSGRLPVGDDLALDGHPEIFVAGDLARCAPGGNEPLPGIAAVAQQQGRYLARTIRARLAGRTPPPFRYRDRGQLAVIGRASAVADLPGIRLSGYPAWLVWVFVHIAELVGYDSRALVIVQWAYNYTTRNRSARLITGRPPA